MFLLALFILCYTNAAAQFSDEYIRNYKIDLDEVGKYYDETIRRLPTDTLGVGRVDRLQLGTHYYVPNPLFNIYPRSDFDRTDELTEYTRDGLQIKFTYPKIKRFAFEEERQGSFIRFTPRDLSQVTTSVTTLAALAERQRSASLNRVWGETTKNTILTQELKQRTNKGLLNISIPVDLPNSVERIIGQGEATNIDISGRESITFAGETRRVSPFIGVEGQQSQPLFPSLDMQQELDVRLQGQIGEKVNIQVDHSSTAISSEQNRIRLNYTGFEDDIVQLIELGNTSLTLPGSQLVSFSGGSQGLFGIKALAQVGALDLTMIASKEEGEVSRSTFTPSGGQIGQTERRSIADINFIRNVYFFFDDPTSPNFFPPLTSGIEVWQSVPDGLVGLENLNTKRGRAWLDQSGRGDDIRAGVTDLNNGLPASFVGPRNFQLLTLGTDYRFVIDAADLETVIGIELVSAVPDNEVLAVAYINSLNDTIGDFQAPDSKGGDDDNPLDLELIKNANQKEDGAFGPAWKYMMRHIYNLGLSNIDRSTLEISIRENANRADPTRPEGSAIPWLRIFGLDRFDESGLPIPDDRIDLNSGIVDLQRGILTFPILRAFDPPPDSVFAWTVSEDDTFTFDDDRYRGLLNPDLYDRFLSTPFDFQKFIIEVTGSSTSRSFSINAFNITEGSEIIRIDGRQLVRNQDYTIDYETGEVELIGEVLDDLSPTSNITVDYEFTPIAGGGSTTLAGFNADYKFGTSATLGTTWLYESKAASTERPRLGEEPTRAIVGDVRATYQSNPRFFTNLVNALPLVNTDAVSSLTFSGEMAMSMPDPNTLGEVYIDDFEGVEDSDVFSLSRRSWRPASPPVDLNDPVFTLPSDKTERVIWYNIEPESGVNRRDLNPTLDEREATLVPTLDLEFDSVTTDSTRWGGVMQGFRGGGLDLTQAQFIEIWVNDFKSDPFERGGQIHIDFGFIDEDFYNPDDNDPDSEDTNFDGFNALTEDTGLDGVFGEDGTGVTGDDGDDDFVVNRDPTTGRFEQINGTENNRILDTEDIDNSGSMETLNAYWTMDVNLAEDAETDIRRDFPTYTDFNHPEESWRRYRIPLSAIQQVSQLGDTPQINQVTHMRIWVDGIEQVLNPGVRRIQFAGFKVVGNRWQQDGIRDLTDRAKGPSETNAQVALGIISTKTDAARYIPAIPPAQVNDIADKEQSLLITYAALDSSEAFRIRKRFAGRGMDWTNYRDINFFVHVDTFTAEMEYYYRIGFDSLNYYEINLPLTKEYFPDRTNNWSQVLVKMADITDLKFLPADSVVSGFVPDLATEGREYEVKMVGLPSLANVRFLYVGVRNKSSTQTQGVREVWVNDIFLGDRKRDVDTAERVNASINMGNVINVSGSWRRTGPDFRGLRQARGSGSEQQSLSLNAKTAVQHFIPTIGFRIPVSGTFTRNVITPKFTPNSDTEVTTPQAQDSLRTESINRGFTATLQRSGSKNPLFRYTFDRLKLNYSLSQSLRRTPTQRDTTLNMSGTADYSITWGQRSRMKLFGNTFFRWWLNSLNFRVTANRATTETYTLVNDEFSRRPGRFSSTVNANGSVSYIPFPSLTSSFRAGQTRDRALKQSFNGVNIGREIRRNHSLNISYKAPPIFLLSLLSPDVGFNTSYREDSSPQIRRPGDPRGVRNVNNSRDTNVKMRFDLGKYLRGIFGAVGLNEKEKPPPPPAGQAANDTTQTDDGGGPDPLIAVRKIATALGNIRRINASARQQFNSNYDRIEERPTLLYQFGITDDSGIVSGGELANEPLNKSNSLNISLDSGTQITENIDVAVRFSRNQNKAESRGSDSETVSYIWPDVNLSWKGIEKWPLFSRYAATASATVAYRETERTSTQAGRVNQTTEDRQFSPAMVFGWKNTLSTTISGQFNRNLSDVRGSLTETTNSTISLDMKYSFSAGKSFRLPIPGLRNKILKSKLDTSLNMAYSQRGGKRSSSGSLDFFEPIPGTNTFRIGPRLSYNFTRALNGSFFVDYSRTFSEATNQTTTIVRVGLNATFTF